MLARALPFHSSDRKKTFKLIKEADPDFDNDPWPNISYECKDLLNKMLIKDPKTRITVDDALKHPFFKKYQKHIDLVKSDYIPSIDQATGQIMKPRKSSMSGGGS
jgi:serine/threonine protein kinase